MLYIYSVCVCLYIHIYIYIIHVYNLYIWMTTMYEGCKTVFQVHHGVWAYIKIYIYIYIWMYIYAYIYRYHMYIISILLHTYIYIYTHQIWYIMNVLIPIRCKGQTSSTIDTSWCAKSQGQTPKFNHRKLNWVHMICSVSVKYVPSGYLT